MVIGPGFSASATPYVTLTSCFLGQDLTAMSVAATPGAGAAVATVLAVEVADRPAIVYDCPRMCRRNAHPA